jgi:hypothetical protein
MFCEFFNETMKRKTLRDVRNKAIKVTVFPPSLPEKTSTFISIPE